MITIRYLIVFLVIIYLIINSRGGFLNKFNAQEAKNKHVYAKLKHNARESIADQMKQKPQGVFVFLSNPIMIFLISPAREKSS